MKLVDIKPSPPQNNNNENSKFEVGDNVRISKYKKKNAKGYVLSLSEKSFVTKKCLKQCVLDICY